MKPTSLLLAAALIACGGSDSDTLGPGEEDYAPSPEITDEGDRPPGSTDVQCELAEDCGYWYCRCEDGAVVNSALCVNGWCQNAAEACPPACAHFGHGGWTGDAGGGPDTPDIDPEEDCGDLGSVDAACDACFRRECCVEGAACAQSLDCLDYWDCVVVCPPDDAACHDACYELYPAGEPLFLDLQACLLDFCAAECG